MKTVRNLAVAAALLGFTAPGVSAANLLYNFSGCGGQSFSTCISGSISYEFSGTDYTDVTVYIENNGTYGELFKAVGLINIQTALPVFQTGPAGYGPPPPNDLSGGGLPSDMYGAVTNSQASMLANGGSGTFVFRFAGALDLTYLEALGVGVHAISGPNGCSNKVGVLANGIVDNADPDIYARCTPTTVPEPASMFLFGAGMVGFLATRRRRNGAELENDEV